LPSPANGGHTTCARNLAHHPFLCTLRHILHPVSTSVLIFKYSYSLCKFLLVFVLGVRIFIYLYSFSIYYYSTAPTIISPGGSRCFILSQPQVSSMSIVDLFQILTFQESGYRVRGAFYVQTIVLILMSFSQQPGLDIVTSNFLTQITPISLIAATYFDPTIDVPYTLIASQFSVPFLVCRISSHNLPISFLKSSKRLKIVSRGWLLDLLLHTCMIMFNYKN
jgi:hypothetical protein